MKLYMRSKLLRNMTALSLASSITATGMLYPIYANEQVDAPSSCTNTHSSTQSQSLQNDAPMEMIPWSHNPQTLQDSSELLILSDLNYVENMLSIGWGQFRKDANPDGGTITLMVEGKPLQFAKGIGAHATSSVVYDLTDYPEYTHFTTYAGVDYSKGNKGNGVVIKLQASHDGKTWVDLGTSPVQTGGSEAHYFDVAVSGYKYLKLYAHHNGNSASDHAVYGYPTLMTEDYYSSVVQNLPFKTVEAYDQELKAYGTSTSVANQHLLNQRTFVNTIGYNQLKASVQMDKKVHTVVSWLLNNEKALEYFITGGVPSHSYGVTLKVLGELHQSVLQDFTDSVEGDLYTKLAMATALSAPDYRTDSVERYQVFKTLYDTDKLMHSSQFRDFPLETLRLVIGNDKSSWVKSDSAHVAWLNDFVRGFDPTAPIGSLNPYTYISYRDGYKHNDPQYYSTENYDKWNQKYKLEAYGIPYGDTSYVPQWVIFEEGAVCGGISGGGVGLHTSVGIPTAFVSQPGHAAYLIYNQNENEQGLWSIGNNISGFRQTNRGGRLPLGWGSASWNTGYRASYFLLSQHALNDYDTYVEALHLVHLAEVYKDEPTTQQAIYRKVLALQPYNLDAMVGLLDTYSTQETTTSEDYLDLAEAFGEALTYFPLPMVDMLGLIRQNLTDEKDLYTIDMLKSQNLLLAEQADASKSLQPGDCRSIATYLLQSHRLDLASFSFDGENAGSILINEKYSNADFTIQYSLDGGESWTETQDQKITLTTEEIQGITPENDIQIGVVGTQPILTIDITAGTSLEGKRIYQNDWENQLIGDVVGLEYSLDGCVTWEAYLSGTNGPRFEGATQEVMMRSKSTGTQLSGEPKSYTFAADENTQTHNYITIDRLSVADYSSQQDNSSRAAVNVIDGNINTLWHSIFDRSDSEKYVTLAVDEPTLISQLQYVPRTDAGNGTITKANIFVSMDGENWTTIATDINWPRNNTVKTYTFDTPVMAKYVKLQAASGHGNYATALMINLYEDSSAPTEDPLRLPLKEILEKADRIIANGQQNYDTLLWDNLLEMRAIGYEVLMDLEAPQVEINSMIAHTKEAFSYLYKQALKDLDALINHLETLVETEYTPESWAILTNELQTAKEIAQSPADGQTQSYIGRLKVALQALEVAIPEVVNQAPQIFGVEDIVVAFGEDFNPLKGVTAYDQEDGDITRQLEVTWGGDIAAVGEHELTYTVADSNSHITHATRKVTVTPPVEPEVPVGDTFDPTKAYIGGETVIYKGQEYVAKWWVQGETPDTSQAWELKLPVNPDGSQHYVPGKAYIAGDIVIYQDAKYEAKWWTTSTPGSDESWITLNTF